jgi:hypothetical protein
MSKKITVLFLVICLTIVYIDMAGAHRNDTVCVDAKKTEQKMTYDFSEDYSVQWEMNFGSDWRYGARYEGPQPIGDCNDDGDNELLIGGRDSNLRVFEWDETEQTYLEMHTLHCPLYPTYQSDPGGFAIGDLTGDGKNEIAATWSAAVHKWIGGKYRIIGWNSWIFQNGGASGDCYIGDCDNDVQNELIMSGGPSQEGSSVPEIVIFEWNGWRLVKVAEWDDTGVNGYVYMAGLGDIDEDGENEIVCGSAYKVVLLDWNKNSNEFDATIIETTHGEDYPFACVCKDSDNDGKNEIHIGYWTPKIKIFEWNGAEYETKFEQYWPDEGALIEALDVGDVDEDGVAEVCAGTDVVHILQWDGMTYVEEAVLPTFGELAVVSIGDCDNDGKNEINIGSVMIDHDQDYMSWVYKYGWEPRDGSQHCHSDQTTTTAPGSLRVIVESALLGQPLGGGSVAAWSLNTGMWYDIQPAYETWGTYIRNDLPAGNYTLRAVVEGYQIQETTITIVAGQETTHTFSLRRALINEVSNTQQLLSSLKTTLNVMGRQFI